MGDSYLLASLKKKSIINDALDYFDEEHNREDECEDCTNNKCKKIFSRTLRKFKKAHIEGTYYETHFEIWIVNIDDS
jgi:hypothetical protein